MDYLIQVVTKHKAMGFLFAANFLASFHVFLLVYINSSFLDSFTSDEVVGAIYTVAALVSIAGLLLMPRILSTIGNYKTLILFVALELGALVGIVVLKGQLLALPLLALHLTLVSLIYFCLDIFLESSSESEEHTGNIRGAFLTVANTALILSPILVGFILTNGDFWKVYLLSSFVLLAFLVLVVVRFKNFKDPLYGNFKIIQTFKEIRKNKSFYNIVMAHLILRFFFAWMVIYMPIYLHQHIGFEWSQIGIMFTIMLLPFVLFELPAGTIADRFFGEKEILTIGFIITAAAVGAIPFITEANFLLWTAVLFASRIGASLIEIMTESYFFKHVSGNDADNISFFRITRPLAYVISPIIASVALLFVDFRFIFLILAVILLWGLRYSLALKDTR